MFDRCLARGKEFCTFTPYTMVRMEGKDQIFPGGPSQNALLKRGGYYVEGTDASDSNGKYVIKDGDVAKVVINDGKEEVVVIENSEELQDLLTRKVIAVANSRTRSEEVTLMKDIKDIKERGGAAMTNRKTDINDEKEDKKMWKGNSLVHQGKVKEGQENQENNGMIDLTISSPSEIGLGDVKQEIYDPVDEAVPDCKGEITLS
jgi:predicted house-cleaning noncanonical NTP pyrophosphatase (MazG superfamily)